MLAAAVALLVTAGPTHAAPAHIDPATLPRGVDPRVAYLVGDTIHDGTTRVPATTRGEHVGLWRTRNGYVVHDWVQAEQVHRLVHVSRAGGTTVLARSAWLDGTAVSSSGRRIAWGEDRHEGGPSTVTVADADTGRLVAGRRFPAATVVALSQSRAVLTLRGPRGRMTAWWWNYRHDTLRRIAPRAAWIADIRHDRVLLATGPPDAFCSRVAVLSDPTRTLWRSCRISPRRWSPDGQLALATYTYFDETGTARWLTVRDRTGERLGRVYGRLDWTATWEDDRHFLTLAESDAGRASVIRCDVAGACERASRLWDLGSTEYPPYYTAPPVVLPNN